MSRTKHICIMHDTSITCYEVKSPMMMILKVFGKIFIKYLRNVGLELIFYKGDIVAIATRHGDVYLCPKTMMELKVFEEKFGL